MDETPRSETASHMVTSIPSSTRKQIMLRFGGSATLDRVVSVPMPKSLPELQHAAAQNFGHSGLLRLYLHGTTLLYHPAQMQQVQDQDIIIVRKADIHRPVTQAGTPRALSTHQADFIRHPLKRPTTAAGADYESSLTDRTKNAPLDGMSRYALDYVQHPYARPEPYQPPNALELHTEPLGKTTYSQEFPWREHAVRKAAGNDRALRESSLSAESKGHPFKGDTSYKIDYPRRPYAAPSELAMSPLCLRQSSVGPTTNEFSATSTYTSDFQKLGPGRQRSCKPKGDLSSRSDPFDGSSEYRREYLEPCRKDRNMWVQLAREAFEGQTAEGLRKLAEEAMRDGGTGDIEVPPGTEMMAF